MKQDGSCAVERDRTEVAKAVENGKMLVACLPPGSWMTSRPGLQPKAMSSLLILPHPSPLLTLMTHGVLC